MLLQDSVVLVTGSTTGIGAAIARHCIEQGAKAVMIHGRNKERAAKLCQELGENAAYFLADLTEPGACEELVAATVKQFGKIDVLVNNAGLSPRGTLDEVTEDKFDWLVKLNMRAPLLLTQAVVRQLRKQKSHGSIVNIGSINAYCGETAMIIYCMTKGALMTMTRNLSEALNTEGIRVNQLNVGWTLTENEALLKQGQGFPENWERFIPNTYAPMGKLLHPQDIARHVVFWASKESAPVSGQVYEVEQYPLIGRNHINKIPLDIFQEVES